MNRVYGKRVYYESFGCQMNAYDTEVLASILMRRGFGQVSRPEEADVIIVNTCSVREHAEKRAIGRLNELSRFRDALLVVCGCMAQRMKDELWNHVPRLNIIAGTSAYDKLPDAIEEALSGMEAKYIFSEMDDESTYSLLGPSFEPSRVAKYVSITRGCNNYCSYCIVPYLRGPLRSKDAGTVLREIQMLEESGAKEVTLIGQNVSAYRYDDLDFIGLLEVVLRETEIKRIRFLTTHPRDVDMRLFHLMADDDRLCPHLHLPIQSGSDRILKLMRRGYKVEDYIAIVDQAREIVPDIAFSTDIIVGFPTETDEDFNRTLELVERVRFESAFTFKYSPREGTRAAEMEDDVPLEVKKKRLAVLNDSIKRIRREVFTSLLGKRYEILLDDELKKGEYHFLKGRTPHFRNVIIGKDGGPKIGEFVDVELKSLREFTFIGEIRDRR